MRELQDSREGRWRQVALGTAREGRPQGLCTGRAEACQRPAEEHSSQPGELDAV